MTDYRRDPFGDPLEPFRKRIQQTTEPVRHVLDKVSADLNKISAPVERFRRHVDHTLSHKVSAPMEQFRRQVDDTLRRLPDPAVALRGLEGVGERIEQALRAAMPPNWQLDEDEWETAMQFGHETGINVVWVPRADVVAELVRAEEGDRDAVLLVREPDILEDLRSSLDEVTHTALQEDVELARRAVAAYGDQHYSAGHALAASVLSGFVNEELGYARFRDARERFTREDPNHVALSLGRITMILRTVGRSLHHTDHVPGPGFNRHATAHGHVDQYTRVNALAALMLVVGLARELDFWLHRQDAERRDSGSAAA